MKFLRWASIGLGTIIVLVISFFVLLMIAEYNPPQTKEVAITSASDSHVPLDTSLSMLLFNIGYAGLGANEDFVMDGGQNVRPKNKGIVESYLTGITDILVSEQADFYMLQEVDQQSKRSYEINQVDHLTSVFPNFDVSYATNFRVLYVPFPLSFHMIGRVESGLVSMSRYHMSEAVRHQLPGEFAWPIRLANLKRSLLITRYEIEGSVPDLIVINGHLSAYDDGSMRSLEMAYLRDLMVSFEADGHYVIVAADFNQTFPEADGLYPVIDEDYYVAPVISSDFLPNRFSFVFDGSTPTCRLLDKPYNPEDDSTQYYVIDGFIVSDNVIIEEIETLDEGFAFSDHNPVRLRFRLT